MAVYYSTDGLQYNPYSLDDLLKPLDKYKEAYDTMESRYENMVLDSKTFNLLLDQNKDPKAYEAYQKYNKALTEAYDLFQKSGLKGSRQNMFNLRRFYNQNIAPIENAYAQRSAEQQREAKDVSKGMLISNSSYDAGLDDYMTGSRRPYKSLNPTKVVNRAKELTLALNNSYMHNGYGGIPDETFALWHQGYTQTLDKNIVNKLNQIQFQLEQEFGIYGDDAKQYILTGMMSGIKYRPKPEKKAQGTNNKTDDEGKSKNGKSPYDI